MKRMLLLVGIFLGVGAPVFAANFSPVLLKYSAPAIVNYDFSGKDLAIPVTVSGKSASTFFLVYSKG